MFVSRLDFQIDPIMLCGDEDAEVSIKDVAGLVLKAYDFKVCAVYQYKLYVQTQKFCP